MADFTLDSLRGGFDDFTPVSSLPKDACRLAENVEFFNSTLGERRAGCQLLNGGLPAGITGNALLNGASWLFRHTPTKNESEDELWVMTGDTDNTPRLYRRTASGWTTITFGPVAGDTPIIADGEGFQVYGQSLHGKLFIAFRSSVDRLHVYPGTGTVLRRAGLAAHAAGPTCANTAAGGAYPATPRYYRTRSVVRSGSTVLYRSEPSPNSTVFTPSGANSGVDVTRPTAIGEGETDWEIEVSLDASTFYRLSTVAIGTTVYTDTAGTSTYSNNTLSDPVGTYGLIPSVKYLLAVDDRLVTGGSWQTAADGSAVRWTPVGTDPLPGPDERLNTTTSPRDDADGLEGGDITGLSRSISTIIVHKFSQFYSLVKTGELVGAYELNNITKVRGAFPRSNVEANDEVGRPCLYWLDPKVGPMRYGANGLEFCGFNIRTLWSRINKNAVVPCHGIYYEDKFQIHYWLSLDSDAYPTTKIVLQTNEVSSDGNNGARRGWATVPSGTRIGFASCSVMFPKDIAATDLKAVPHIGKFVWFVNAVAIKDVVQRCDVGTTDAHTSGDTSSGYTAKVKSRPFTLANIPNQFGVGSAALLGLAGSKVKASLIRNYGVETVVKNVDMTASGSETHVAKPIDNLSMSELRALEVQFEDDPDNLTQWQLFQFVLVEKDEDTA